MPGALPATTLPFGSRACPPETCNTLAGVVVPMPTLPLLFQIPDPGKYAVFETDSCVVEAFTNVVRPVTDSVPVAVRFAEVRLPLKKPLPATERSANGEVVPIPTFPVLEMNMVDVACAVPASSPTMKFPLARESEEASTPERESVPAAPPTREPSVPEYESPVPSESVVVATLAKVLTPEK